MSLAKARMPSLKDKYYGEVNRTNYIEPVSEDEVEEEEEENNKRVEINRTRNTRKHGKKN